MADAVLFEFLHTEMVAELWAPNPDPGPGGPKMSLSVLEGMGFRVGQALGERLPRETLSFREELDVLKFLCKDLWVAVFQKQMDGLRTNHQGTYVLQDNSFPLLVPMASGLQYVEEAPKVRGAGSVPFGSHLPGPPQGRPLPRFRGWDLGAGFPSSHSALCPPPQFLAFTCGLLCGTLHTLGFQSLVTASVTALPACRFQVVILKS
uniref:Trafficking protein particle complex subunit 6A n=1 Tax=Castor canadensis TaxID=51338 RepID=A0A8C0X948_CASCN